jgi:MoaA/NifB/PqqE/SkfB family radical SAM enzyme
MEAEETEKQIKNIGWTLGNDCPCKCKHCYSMSVREKGKNLTKEIVDKVIKQVKK